jgi:hypothetical protein
MADADRGIEHYAFLQSLMNGERVYPRLVKHFRDATDGLQPTAHSPRPSDSGPSAASRRPTADVLGRVYEQFLGNVIRLTGGCQAKVEEKPEVPSPAHGFEKRPLLN